MPFCRPPDRDCSRHRPWHCCRRVRVTIDLCSVPSAPEPSRLCLLLRELSISCFPQNSGYVNPRVHCHKCDAGIREVPLVMGRSERSKF
jgi:hypothetical protein